jgi:hypothetical protein
MATVRRCLGCQATYPATEAMCEACGSYAAELEEQEPKPEPKAKPTRRRKT